MSKPHLKFKLIIIGDTAVGKTSMLLKYTDNKFPEKHLSTIGVEFKAKEIETEKYNVTLQIWDTAGQERYKSIAKSFFNSTNGIIFVYDITSRDTFESIREWIKDSENYGTFSRIICGNKIDLNDLRVVKFDELKELGLKKKIDILETSAKDGININEAFKKIVDLIISSHTSEELLQEFQEKKNRVELVKSTKKNTNSGCCKK